MAITYKGIVKTYSIFGNDALTQNLFTIENGFASRVNMNIKRFTLQMDAISTLTSVQPIAKTSRATNISGGVIIPSAKFDTTETADPNTKVRCQVNEGEPIVATSGDTIWQQFMPRMHTAVEQQRAEDHNCLPSLLYSPGTAKFILRPGESLLVELTCSAVTTNTLLKDTWVIQAYWEEESINSFTISGTVTLGGSPVDGAKVIVFEADDVSLTNGFLREVITTAGGGLWSSTIRTGKIGAAFVQYNNGGTYYTAPGSPFLS